MSYLCFTSMLNEKKVPLKNMVWRQGVTKNVLLEGFQKLRGGVGNISKKGGLDKKEVEKIQGRRIVTLHSMSVYVSTLHVYVTYITRKQSLKAVL